jgi:hypothetical protein
MAQAYCQIGQTISIDKKKTYSLKCFLEVFSLAKVFKAKLCAYL